MKCLKRIPFHVVLSAIYPVLLLYWVNRQQIALKVIWRPILILLFLAFLFLCLLYRPMRRDLFRAALAATVLIIWITFYGHLANLLVGWTEFELLGRSKFLLPVTSIFVLALLWLIWRKQLSDEITASLNILFTIGVILIVFQIIWWSFNATQYNKLHLNSNSVTNIDYSGGLPDIYIIILDSYARQDVLKSDFGFENLDFTDYLARKGFKVSNCNYSNYNSTDYSLASTLNMKYLDAEEIDYAEDGIGYLTIQEMIKHSEVRKQLEETGYSTWSFETGYSFADWADADHYLTYESEPSSDLNTTNIRPFESLFIESSIFRTVLLFVSASNRAADEAALWEMRYPFQTHILQTQYILKKLEEMPLIPGPKLIHAHLMVPHKPLVFSESGEILTDPRYFGNDGDAVNELYYKNGYVSQVKFINQRLIKIIDNLQKESRIKPIILVFSDHGYYYSTTHFENLIAIYLPNANSKWSTPSSNVNIFSTLFNEEFGTSYALLPDKRYVVNNGEHGERLFSLMDNSTLMPCENPNQ